ncbi:PRE5 [Ecytonucleospora hepatopenaei]|uniref:PRE5 n=1 Tax=Ecytonucleospora hepatopenaei TaxID=646526 RepID=A0A1W0E808_9MICR|nr:PRE5 [Ecytonucleospora hepatopenaei]
MSNNKQYAPYNIYAPDGNIFQLKYAHAATELGNTTVGLTNGQIAVLMVHKPKTNKYALDSLHKITKIGKNGLFAFSGVTNDGIKYIDYLQHNVLAENITKDREIHPIYVFDDLCYEMAYNALSNQRLYGASGILICEFEGKLHITEVVPNSSVIAVKGTSIGARNQSAKTILSVHADDLEEFDEGKLIETCHKALINAHPDAKEPLVGDQVECYVVKVGEKPRQIVL